MSTPKVVPQITFDAAEGEDAEAAYQEDDWESSDESVSSAVLAKREEIERIRRRSPAVVPLQSPMINEQAYFTPSATATPLISNLRHTPRLQPIPEGQEVRFAGPDGRPPSPHPSITSEVQRLYDAADAMNNPATRLAGNTLRAANRRDLDAARSVAVAKLAEEHKASGRPIAVSREPTRSKHKHHRHHKHRHRSRRSSSSASGSSSSSVSSTSSRSHRGRGKNRSQSHRDEKYKPRKRSPHKLSPRRRHRSSREHIASRPSAHSTPSCRRGSRTPLVRSARNTPNPSPKARKSSKRQDSDLLLSARNEPPLLSSHGSVTSEDDRVDKKGKGKVKARSTPLFTPKVPYREEDDDFPDDTKHSEKHTESWRSIDSKRPPTANANASESPVNSDGSTGSVKSFFGPTRTPQTAGQRRTPSIVSPGKDSRSSVGYPSSTTPDHPGRTPDRADKAAIAVTSVATAAVKSEKLPAVKAQSAGATTVKLTPVADSAAGATSPVVVELSTRSGRKYSLTLDEVEFDAPNAFTSLLEREPALRAQGKPIRVAADEIRSCVFTLLHAWMRGRDHLPLAEAHLTDLKNLLNEPDDRAVYVCLLEAAEHFGLCNLAYKLSNAITTFPNKHELALPTLCRIFDKSTHRALDRSDMQRLAATASKKGLYEAIPAGIEVLLCDAAINLQLSDTSEKPEIYYSCTIPPSSMAKRLHKLLRMPSDEMFLSGLFTYSAIKSIEVYLDYKDEQDAKQIRRHQHTLASLAKKMRSSKSSKKNKLIADFFVTSADGDGLPLLALPVVTILLHISQPKDSQAPPAFRFLRLQASSLALLEAEGYSGI